MEAVTLTTAPFRSVAADVRAGAWDDPGPWRELFDAVASGDEGALAGLYDLAASRLYGLALWRTGSREDAADVMQETFVRVAESRGRLGTVRDPRWWLLAVAHRLATDRVRRRTRHPEVDIEACADLVAATSDHAAAIDAARACRLLREVPPKQRAVVYLHHFGEMTFAEIGRSLGIPRFTAASRYRLALQRLRALIGGVS